MKEMICTYPESTPEHAKAKIKNQQKLIRSLIQWVVVLFCVLLFVLSLAAFYICKYYSKVETDRCQFKCSWSDSNSKASKVINGDGYVIINEE